ncbi:MAG TPA: 2-oxoglutarate dehydrogenase complex dihydrolipoyllysine-residue succinyltransferase [Anaeromyxobacter sp.]|nr:2-oxoglutarate dehydrogenase complex dihydrolipoyllysine-residue succinyltransferase [Anaeromyxobacter sp.]
MSIPLKVPSLGESITQATIGAWLKKEGDPVQADEPLVEVESEKATVAVPAPAAGVLRKVLKESGATVAVGEVIGELEEGARAPAPTPTAPRTNGKAAPAPAPAPAVAPASAAAPPAGSGPAAVPATPPAPGGRRLSPSARRLAAERGLSPDALGAGAVRKEDVLRALEPPRAIPAPAPAGDGGLAGRERLVPMTPLRRTVARRLVEAQHAAAILTTFNEVDMSRVLALRERHGEPFLARHGVKLGFMSFFVKAAVEALRAFPAVNAEVRGEAIVYKDHYDVGVAVGGGKGLVVPVVRDADALSFAEIEKTIAELARKARENRITMDDLSGGTFTISNGGIYGSLLSTPILNPPQSGILGLHKIEKRAVVGEGDQVVVRPMMYLALSYDHRIVDGREAVSFLVKVKEGIEDPERILLEV